MILNSFNIRPITDSDFSEWSILWEGYNNFYQRTLSPEIIKISWNRFLNPNEPMYALVAEENGKLIGLAHYLFHRNTAMINYSCYLQDLFTAEISRGKGVGAALIRTVYDQAKIAGSTRVYWQTHETNKIAMKLYDKVAKNSGFVVYRKEF